jgi:hypothetical protein
MRSEGYRLSNMALNKNGISFVELLIVLLILGVCIVPLMRMFTASMDMGTYVDDMRSAIDLAREETEKVKNLALSLEQVKALGNVVSPPIYLNKNVWRTARVISKDSEPLEVYVYVFKGDDFENPYISLATIVSK